MTIADKPPPPPPAAMGAAIVALERHLHGQLVDWRVCRGVAGHVAPANVAWADAVWRAAVASPPLVLPAPAIASGLALARRPVFISGVHRSGTTLVLGMLDSHPRVCALPAEGGFYTGNLQRLTTLQRPAWQSDMAQEWLRRLANPNNQPPYLLLGRSSGRRSPYVLFARQLMAWWPHVEAEFGPLTAMWPLIAVMLAYAHTRLPLRTCLGLQRWIDKTPTIERHIDRLRAEFPEALFVHTVRDPAAVYASRRMLENRTFGRFRGRHSALQDMHLSYATAALIHRSATAQDCQLVRYEQLLRDPAAGTRRLAQFLGLAHTGSMLLQTTSGRRARNNSSFDERAVRTGLLTPAVPGSGGLSRFERALLHRFLAAPAAVVGYHVQSMGTLPQLFVWSWLLWQRVRSLGARWRLSMR